MPFLNKRSTLVEGKKLVMHLNCVLVRLETNDSKLEGMNRKLSKKSKF